MTSGAQAGLDAMRRGAGLREHQSRAFLRVVGRDARDFLQRMTSQDLGALPGGGFTRTLVLTPEGRILGAPWVWALEDHLLLDLDVETAPVVRERLERYVLTDDVGFEDATPHHARVLLVGPEASGVLAAEGFQVPEAGTFRSVDCGGTRVHVARAGVGEPPVYRLLMRRPRSGVVTFPGREDPDVRTVGAAAWNAFRVLTRRPAWGRELTSEILPLEARVEDEAISFDKGCYPGQEPVVMAKHRGHPPTLLVRLRTDGGTAGAALRTRNGRPVGRLTTVTSLTRPDESNALGFVRHALASEAPTLEVEGGGQAKVLEGEGA